MRQSDVGVLSLFASKHAADWQLCGVLISGTVSTLLWEHGFSLFSLTPVLLGLTALPVIGGCLTPEKPPYTIIVFAVGSILPFINDMPAVPMGYWPVGWIRVVLRGNSIGWHEVFTTLIVLLVTAIAIAIMSVLYSPLVYLGWKIRRSATSW